MISIFIALVFLFAFFATILPVLPGTLIAASGILLHKLILGDASVSWGFVAFAFALAIMAQLLDAAFTYWGARRFGASWKGALGAVLGGIFGLIFFNIPGMLIGPVVGAFLFEWLNARPVPDAARAGFGTLIGSIFAFGSKVLLTIGLIVTFYIQLMSA